MGTRSTPVISSPQRVLANYPRFFASAPSTSAPSTPSAAQVTVSSSSSSMLVVTGSTGGVLTSGAGAASSSSAPLLGLGANAPSTGISAAEASSLQGFLQSQLDNFKQQMIASLQMKMAPPTPTPGASSGAAAFGAFAPSSSSSSSTSVPASLLANPFGGSSTWSAGAFGPSIA